MTAGVGAEQPRKSEYLEWAKAQGTVRYNLAFSGVPPYDVRLLSPSVDDFTMAADNEYGWRPLIERIAKRYDVESSCVVLAHGTSMANYVACAALLEAGDEVLLEHPAYDPLRVVPEFLHCSVRSFERRADDGYRLDIDVIEQTMTPNTRLIVISNLHNPTGRLDSREDLERLGALAEAREVYVLVDEVYLEWVYGAPDTVPSAINLSHRFVTTRSLTKVFGFAALRAGWILAEPEAADAMRRLNGLFTNAMAHPTERLAARVFDHADEIVSQQRERVDRNRALVSRFIASQERLRWAEPVAGTVGFVHLAGDDVEPFIARARADFDLLLVPGKYFGAPNYFRIGFGMASEVVEGGLDALGRALK